MTATEDRKFLAERITENETSIRRAWQDTIKHRAGFVSIPDNELPCVIEHYMLLIKMRLDERVSGAGTAQGDSSAAGISRWDEINILLTGEEAIAEKLVETRKETDDSRLMLRIRRELNLVTNELIRERTV